MPTKKTLPGLEPIHYVDIVNPTMLKRWLSNTKSHSAWKDAVHTVTDLGDDQDTLEMLPAKPTNYNKVDPILLGKAIKEYVDLVLNDWTEDSTDETAKVLVASLPLFVEMSKTLPHVNPSDEYKYAFRGTDLSDKMVKQFIKNNQNPGDWVQTNVGDRKYMAYKGPKKRMFTYKPHRQVQSWSTSDKAATGFGSHIIATPLDLSFFFDPSFMNQYGFRWENETIHFGKEPMKVALLVDVDDYDEIVDYMNMTPAEKRKKNDPANATPESDPLQYRANLLTDGDKLMMTLDDELNERGVDDWYHNNRSRLLKQKEKLGKAEFKKKYTDILKKVKATPNRLGGLVGTGVLKYLKETSASVNETIEIQDKEGTLTMPL